MVNIMKVWIIYKNEIKFSKIIVEMIEEYLKDYFDVSVGRASRIAPTLLVEEDIDYLVIGDIINNKIPSREIQNWLLKYREISRKKKIILKMVSGFYVISADIKAEPFWVEFLHNNVKAEIIYPPVLRLNLNIEELALETRVKDLVKNYSYALIKFILNNKNIKNKEGKIK